MAINFRDARGRFRKPFRWEKNQFYVVDTLSEGLAKFCFKTTNAFGDYAQEFANELVDYARDNAPWDDRTGDARAGLEGEVVLTDDNFEIDLLHTVEYGIWLEIRWGAKYAIIIPTIETMGPRLYEKMNGMLGEIVYYD